MEFNNKKSREQRIRRDKRKDRHHGSSKHERQHELSAEVPEQPQLKNIQSKVETEDDKMKIEEENRLRFAHLKRETDDIAALTGKKPSKKDVVSIWPKFQDLLPEYPEEERGADFETLLNLPQGGYFQFQSERNWEKAITPNMFSHLFTPDIQVLTEAIACIPLYERLGLSRDRFNEEDLQTMDNDSKKNASCYNSSSAIRVINKMADIITNTANPIVSEQENCYRTEDLSVNEKLNKDATSLTFSIESAQVDTDSLTFSLPTGRNMPIVSSPAYKTTSENQKTNKENQTVVDPGHSQLPSSENSPTIITGNILSNNTKSLPTQVKASSVPEKSKSKNICTDVSTEEKANKGESSCETHTDENTENDVEENAREKSKKNRRAKRKRYPKGPSATENGILLNNSELEISKTTVWSEKSEERKIEITVPEKIKSADKFGNMECREDVVEKSGRNSNSGNISIETVITSPHLENVPRSKTVAETPMLLKQTKLPIADDDHLDFLLSLNKPVVAAGAQSKTTTLITQPTIEDEIEEINPPAIAAVTEEKEDLEDWLDSMLDD